MKNFSTIDIYRKLFSDLISRHNFLISLKNCSELISSKYISLEYRQELRINTLLEELSLLRKTIADREDTISKLRLEINHYTTRVINYKVTDEQDTTISLIF